MAAWYTKLSMCGSAAASSRKQQELIAAAAVVQTLGKKRKWGGSVPGHETKDRDRIGGDIRLNNDYFGLSHSTTRKYSVEGNCVQSKNGFSE